jgi:hypothetical protein
VILLLLLPGPNEVFFDAVESLISVTGTEPALISEGYFQFRFWEQ